MPTSRAPLALAGFLAIPIFFASLMAVSLAIEKPKAFEWMRGGHLIRRFHDPTAALELRIWVLSFVPPLLLVLVGLFASHLRRVGIYVVAVAAIADGLGLLVRLGTWERHHTSRYPFGEDLYPDSSTSSLISKGQWEKSAYDTAHSLVKYTIALALGAILIAAVTEWRRRRGHPQATPLAGSELQQTGGAATTSSA